MQAKLYGFSISNPTQTARLALKFKGVEYKNVELLPGMHPLLMKLHGFERDTVPGMKIDGRKVEGSMAIVQELERLAPEPSLYPADPEKRRAVEEAERWGDEELQMVPRRIVRWVMANDNSARTRVAADLGIPLPSVVAALNKPIAGWIAKRVNADEAAAREQLVNLRATLDKVDALIADGVIGDADAPNAADFQIAPSIRAIGALGDLRPLLAGRPCDALARRLLPRFEEAAEGMLPPHMLAAAGL
jgi:glutathione S-transferase